MSKEYIIDAFRDIGRKGALDLRANAAGMTGTEIIAKEQYAPDFDGTKDYSEYPVCAPVACGGQVYALQIPHNAGHYPDATPENSAMWYVLHTTDPKKAKPFVKPTQGTKDMYRVGEYMIWEDGLCYLCLRDTDFSPEEHAPDWEAVT